jgi:DNA-binding MarR family transcriptional regulator
MFDELITEVQRLYPQIYVACHVDHVRASSTKWKLSSRDSSVLAHLDPHEPTSPRELASHLGVVPSTLSAALARLERLGYITSEPVSRDQRKRALRLTAQGVQAMTSTSVLDRDRLGAALARLSDRDRKAAVRGLALLAGACR